MCCKLEKIEGAWTRLGLESWQDTFLHVEYCVALVSGGQVDTTSTCQGACSGI